MKDHNQAQAPKKKGPTKQVQNPQPKPTVALNTTTKVKNIEENWHEKYLYLSAEIKNIKKRIARDQAILDRMANKALILDLLPTLDDLERAINTSKKNEQNNQETEKGLKLILTNLVKNLQEKGLQLIKATIGEEPNPEQHHVLTKVPTNEQTLKGKITEVVTKGYFFHDQIIRPAQVIIGA